MNAPSLSDINGELKRFSSPKFIKSHYPEFYDELLRIYPNTKKFTEKLYLWFFGEPKPCPTCCKQTKFKNWSDGYAEYCSQTCARKKSGQKAQQTKVQKYGHNGVSKETIEKRRKTKVQKYGHNGVSKETIEKRRKTCKNKYGAIHPMQVRSINEKMHATMQTKYGVEHALQSETLIKKSQETCMRHHNTRTPCENPDIMARVKTTQLKRYGGMGQGSSMIKEKIIHTNLSKHGRMYGFDYAKVKQTCLERYGVVNPLIAMCANGDIVYHGYSRISQNFCRDLDKVFANYCTQYATKNGEKHIQIGAKNYYVDYFVPELNLVIEFYGDSWHGNPKLYGPNDKCFPADNNILASQIWDKDKLRESDLRNAGYKFVAIWESEYKECNDIKLWILDKLTDCNIDINL